jgi:hypothetical protein
MLTHLDVESVVAMDAAQHTFRAGFMFARDYYEDLITTGKLRVVEEVECRNTGKDEAWCEWLKCPCGESTRVGSNYCPGCGNKIKRA